jgi:hypothetical protein
MVVQFRDCQEFRFLVVRFRFLDHFQQLNRGSYPANVPIKWFFVRLVYAFGLCVWSKGMGGTHLTY